MQVIEVQFTPWDQSYYFKPESQNGQPLAVKLGDQVIVETVLGVDLGRVILAGEMDMSAAGLDEVKPILRLATPEDQLKLLELNKDNGDLLEECRGLIKKYQLAMKLVAVHKSFDDNRVTFAFIADGRVDFRELLKELIRHHKKSIRLQQLGVRDEAKIKGDTGPCGRPLCCRTHLKELGNVTTDMAKNQQIAHRGSDRLSGSCGRLKCCLRYEEDLYSKLSRGLPALGSRIKTKQGAGTVVGWHTLKGTVDVDLGQENERNIVEVAVK